MKKTGENLSIKHYSFYMIVLILFLCVLSFFISSCTEVVKAKDNNKTESTSVTGNDGNLYFALNLERYNEEENIAPRNTIDSKAEKVIVSLDDDLSMLTKLKPVNKGVRTRSTDLRSFVPNTFIYIVAYRQNADPTTYTYEHHVGYRVVASALTSTLVREDLNPFSLTVGSTYKFVAYSYNDDVTPLPASSFTKGIHIEDIHPSLDLIWGTSGNVSITSGSNHILIPMKHLFSKVHINVLSNLGNISAISDVKMRGYTAKLDVENGVVFAHTDNNMTFENFSSFETKSVSSDSRIVFTAGAFPTIVTIGSLNIGGQTYSDLTTTFARKLRSGTEYDVKIRIGNSNHLADDLPPAGFTPYVGACWKHNQKDERLIRMARPSNNIAADGAWSATVVKGADWIVLDTIRTAGNDFRTPSEPALSGKEASFEYTNYLSDNSIHIAGIMDASKPEIYFRIGLKNTLSNPSDHRYGIVLLTYADNTKRHRIFVRQGVAPDNLILPFRCD